MFKVVKLYKRPIFPNIYSQIMRWLHTGHTLPHTGYVLRTAGIRTAAHRVLHGRTPGNVYHFEKWTLLTTQLVTLVIWAFYLISKYMGSPLTVLKFSMNVYTKNQIGISR